MNVCLFKVMSHDSIFILDSFFKDAKIALSIKLELDPKAINVSPLNST